MTHPTRRSVLKRTAALAAVTLTGMRLSPVFAQQRVIKVGTLKLIHGVTPYFYSKFAPAGTTIEVIPFESPTDGKNAVVTGTVDFGIYGLAAATLGAAAGEPVVIVGAACNRGMAIVAAASSKLTTFTDLKGKRIGIWPGSTQEVVFMDRLATEKMTLRDVEVVRVSFSDMASALARGDLDAYVGAEPAPGISLANGTGRILEYPYTTPTGSLNMVLTSSEAMLKKDPEKVRALLKIHRAASEFAMSDKEAFIAMAMQRLGQQRRSIELAAPNVELTWRIDDKFVTQARYYGSQMLERKQIRALPDYSRLIPTATLSALSS
ncbi:MULTISPECIES: NrtA/SsuA/CpmA family ABC transporter substrate-binding protein [unclassified Polaromonas]|uniref:ABC transporter substrate-binding protein n=1 Tax=unclassified Polaromonas TaxID=2638319 RepID=UPI000BCA099C|nr:MULTISPECIES: NrtA/SsuA/CpmA family ABC transporter substrate-binding protein [unclassified Polaromonas]OYY37371.1 MAG: ABC transporter substrate-binding protein [Polaromonas sp. 35-63-35]OYZ21607.1 MAG: ABC transporter substrate-binding protein [Polaromonas sp. 16-63-31]OYZ77751.1 MAG: ABC transporter substrate-binding protein [Polaromonas sp. 24-63-21]OZA49923.1 MAG: ABC transporter substrate-binding protein [Polaromonas sp. 17-63-33]OZA87089.1 MAG: ABC transporter substrate-binding prote